MNVKGTDVGGTAATVAHRGSLFEQVRSAGFFDHEFLGREGLSIGGWHQERLMTVASFLKQRGLASAVLLVGIGFAAHGIVMVIVMVLGGGCGKDASHTQQFQIAIMLLLFLGFR